MFITTVCLLLRWQPSQEQKLVESLHDWNDLNDWNLKMCSDPYIMNLARTHQCDSTVASEQGEENIFYVMDFTLSSLIRLTVLW